MQFYMAPFSRAESDAHLDRYRTQSVRDGHTMYAVEELGSETFLGVLGIQILHTLVPGLRQPAVEIGWRLHSSAQGKGLATEGAQAILTNAWSYLRLSEVVAITTVSNVRSRRVMEKLNMVHRPELDFDHPSVATDHPFCRHVLYSIASPYLGLGSRGEGACDAA